MFNRTNLLIVAVAVIGALLGLLAGARFGGKPEPVAEIVLPPGMQVLHVGDTRIDLRLADIDGHTRALNEWSGRPVLINFWATWCGPCRAEMPLLDHVRRVRQRSAGNNSLEVVGIAIDDANAVREFLKDNPVAYPILTADEESADPSLLFGDTRGVLPYSVLIGASGKVLAQRAGSFNGGDLDIWLNKHLSD